MKQTAVEWLYNNLLENPLSNEDIEYNEAVFENAKEMEKLQQGYSEEEVLHLLDSLWDRLDIWYNEKIDREFNLIDWFNQSELKKK